MKEELDKQDWTFSSNPGPDFRIRGMERRRKGLMAEVERTSWAYSSSFIASQPEFSSIDDQLYTPTSTTLLAVGEGPPCGMLFCDYTKLQQLGEEDESCELVLLSRANRCTHPERRPGDPEIDQALKHIVVELDAPENAWAPANVMLVKWRGELAERIAIGQVIWEVWKDLGPRKKYMRLA